MFEAIGKRIREVAVATGVVTACMLPMQAQQPETAAQSAGTMTVSAQTVERLQQRLAELESEVTKLKAQMKEMRSAASSTTVSVSNAAWAHTTTDDLAESAALSNEARAPQGPAFC